MSLITFQTHNDKAVLRLEAVEAFGNREYYKCDLVLRSGKFCAKVPFYFDAVALAEALQQLIEMESTLSGTAVIGQQNEEDYIQIVVNRYGQVIVSGTIIEYGEYKQRLEFVFRTDQTMLGPLIKDLSQLLK